MLLTEIMSLHQRGLVQPTYLEGFFVFVSCNDLQGEM